MTVDRREEPLLLTIPEAAALLRQHRRTVYRKIAAGAIAAVRLGTHAAAPLRIRASELDRYVSGASAAEGARAEPLAGTRVRVVRESAETCTLVVEGLPIPAVADVFGPPPDRKVEPMTPGQRRALFAVEGALERAMGEEGAGRRVAMEECSRHFGREITSHRQLDEREASWAIDRLKELARAERAE